MDYNENKKFIQEFQKLVKKHKPSERDIKAIVSKLSGLTIISTTYMQTEEALFGYVDSDRYIRTLDQQLELYQKNPAAFGFEYCRRSHDISIMSNGSDPEKKGRDEIAYESLLNIKRVFISLQNAIEIIEPDKFFEIIELYYFHSKNEILGYARNDFGIAKILKMHVQEVRRQRERLVKRLEWLLYWPDIVKNVIGHVNNVEKDKV